MNSREKFNDPYLGSKSATPLDEVMVTALRRFDAGEEPKSIFADHARYESILLDIFLGANIYHQTGRQLRYAYISIH